MNAWMIAVEDRFQRLVFMLIYAIDLIETCVCDGEGMNLNRLYDSLLN